MTGNFNQYGDQLKPTENGHGVDISSQRQDELDRASLIFIHEAQGSVKVVDLGGGFGAHAIKMAEAGADVLMIDIADMRTDTFKRVASTGRLRFMQKNIVNLTPADLPEKIDVLYSQRTIHYLRYEEAKATLKTVFNQMSYGGRAFISAAGWDTEYGRTYPDRDKPIEERFSFVAADMQEKHSILHRITIYKEEEFAQLLREVGFSDINVTRSAFGNIKARALKI